MGALASTSIAVIGAGTMAGALIRGLLAHGACAPTQICAADPLERQRALLERELGIRTVATGREAVAGAGIVILAVKPQVIGSVFAELGGQLPYDTLLLSIVAGLRSEAIRAALGVPAVVRVMPNTPGQIGEGISVWRATAETTPAQREQAREIVTALGEEVAVDDEHALDMATALNGSGPAYVFLFIEALIDAGVHLGFSRPIAEKLAVQTVRGSAVFAEKSGLHPAVLRNMVTSPAGTTAEALYELEEGGLRAVVDRAVRAAYERARALGETKQ